MKGFVSCRCPLFLTVVSPHRELFGTRTVTKTVRSKSIGGVLGQ